MEIDTEQSLRGQQVGGGRAGPTQKSSDKGTKTDTNNKAPAAKQTAKKGSKASQKPEAVAPLRSRADCLRPVCTPTSKARESRQTEQELTDDDSELKHSKKPKPKPKPRGKRSENQAPPPMPSSPLSSPPESEDEHSDVDHEMEDELPCLSNEFNDTVFNDEDYPAGDEGKHLAVDDFGINDEHDEVVNNTPATGPTQAAASVEEAHERNKGGRPSAERNAIFREGVEKLSELLAEIAKESGYKTERIIEALFEKQGRGPNLWNIYQRYLASNLLGEISHLPEAERPKTTQRLAIGTVQKLWELFKERSGEYGEAFLLSWRELQELSDTNVCFRERSENFDAFCKRVQKIMKEGADVWCFDSVFMACGRVVNQDQSLGEILHAGKAEDFFSRFSVPESTILGHFRAHVFNAVSMESAPTIGQRIMATPIPDNLVATPSADLKEALVGRIAKTSGAAERKLQDEVFLRESLQQFLAKLKLNSNQIWRGLPTALSSKKYTIFNWPLEIPWPHQTTRRKGIAGLCIEHRKAWFSALKDPIYPLELKPWAIGSTSKGTPVIVRRKAIGKEPEVLYAHDVAVEDQPESDNEEGQKEVGSNEDGDDDNHNDRNKGGDDDDDDDDDEGNNAKAAGLLKTSKKKRILSPDDVSDEEGANARSPPPAKKVRSAQPEATSKSKTGSSKKSDTGKKSSSNNSKSKSDGSKSKADGSKSKSDGTKLDLLQDAKAKKRHEKQAKGRKSSSPRPTQDRELERSCDIATQGGTHLDKNQVIPVIIEPKVESDHNVKPPRHSETTTPNSSTNADNTNVNYVGHASQPSSHHLSPYSGGHAQDRTKPNPGLHHTSADNAATHSQSQVAGSNYNQIPQATPYHQSRGPNGNVHQSLWPTSANPDNFRGHSGPFNSGPFNQGNLVNNEQVTGCFNSSRSWGPEANENGGQFSGPGNQLVGNGGQVRGHAQPGNDVMVQSGGNWQGMNNGQMRGYGPTGGNGMVGNDEQGRFMGGNAGQFTGNGTWQGMNNSRGHGQTGGDAVGGNDDQVRAVGGITGQPNSNWQGGNGGHMRGYSHWQGPVGGGGQMQGYGPSGNDNNGQPSGNGNWLGVNGGQTRGYSMAGGDTAVGSDEQSCVIGGNAGQGHWQGVNGAQMRGHNLPGANTMARNDDQWHGPIGGNSGQVNGNGGQTRGNSGQMLENTRQGGQLNYQSNSQSIENEVRGLGAGDMFGNVNPGTGDNGGHRHIAGFGPSTDQLGLTPSSYDNSWSSNPNMLPMNQPQMLQPQRSPRLPPADGLHSVQQQTNLNFKDAQGLNIDMRSIPADQT
ncbi:hypothetical protein BJ165DRAFT_1406320 [Panaeolus papilionaceus]|nr:hypothetical protein BJ165DRAFT_1406320 [Panaeolus papilionaceus]